MKKFWSSIGIVAFWVSLPALWIYLRNSKRTRVLIICGDEFLLVRGWLGRGDWSLPGGGLHKGENSLQALIREVKEETGIALFEKDVVFLYSAEQKNNGIQFSYDCFAVRLPAKPNITVQKYEITEYMWVPHADPKVHLSNDASFALEQWQKIQ